MVTGIGSTSMSPAMMQRPGNRPPPAEKFEELDTDSNGALSTEELLEMAEEMAELSGRDISVDDLLGALDADGNGTLELAEMPKPPQGEFRGPPPFLDAEGSVQDSPRVGQDFNPLDSLMSYLDASEDESETESQWDLTA